VIRFIRPVVPEPEAWLPYLRRSYDDRVFSNTGPAARRLEAALAERWAGPDREVVLTASCTTGLAAALLALGATGDVVVPAFTFPATAHAVRQSGCRPVFCDVSPDTWELDPEALATVLRRHPASAVVHVRAFGFCRDVTDVAAVASRHGARVVVDAAAALGGRFADGRPVGGQGDVEVFSMHVTKVFGVGEGGAIFAAREHAERVRRACNFGLADGDVTMAGVNGKLSDVHAAIGLAVLDRIDDVVARRQEVGRRYARHLADVPWATPASDVGAPPLQTFPLLVDTSARAAALVEHCRRRGVELRRYYAPALHLTSAFASCERGRLEVAERLAARMVCLPVHSDMTDVEIATVLGAVASCG
jgi:dTDP-4-amino-4,6-dideoxygalactose transaminase